MGSYGAIVVGGGHNGLICAAYLSGAIPGEVLLLERRDILGGATVTEEIYPGFSYTTAAQVISLLRPQVVDELRLRDHGFEFIPMESSFTPFSDGRYLLTGESEDRDLESVAQFSERDAETWPAFHRMMGRLADAVRPTLDRPPPDMNGPRLRDLLDAGPVARALRRLSRFDRGQLIKVLTMSSREFVAEWFESDQIRASMGASGAIGLWGSPSTPGTAAMLLHYGLGEMDGQPGAWGYVRGGMGGLPDAIAAAARERGATLRTGATVSRVLLKNGRAAGVELEGGERLEAPIVVSGADPRHTFLGLMDEHDLPTEFRRRIERFRMTGNSSKVNLALSELPGFEMLQGNGSHLRGEIEIVGDHPDYLERAFDDFRAGGCSKEPYLMVVIPSTLDDSLAPPGKHVVSIAARFLPYEPADGPWTDAGRERWGDIVVDAVSRFAPNLRESILHRQVITPLDLESVYGLSGGSIVHGDMSADQLYSMRPAAGWSGYRTPVSGMYLCGSGAHPGGGVMGAPGRNAARVILRDQKRRRRYF